VKTFRSSTLILRTSLVALTLVAAASVALAGSITYTATLGPTLTDFNDLALSPAIYQFNGNNLTSVVITLSGSGGGPTSVTNNSPTSQKFKITETSNVILDSLNGSLDAALGDFEADYSYTSSQITLGGGATDNLGVVSLSCVGTCPTVQETFTGANLSLFEGTSNLDLVLSSLSGYGFSGGGNNIVGSIQNIDTGTVTVTYNYSGAPPPAVPEPGTLGLFGTGLLGLAGLVRFKFMKSR
jgi:hypothetical protein